MCQDEDLFTKPLDIRKFYNHAKTGAQCSVVRFKCWGVSAEKMSHEKGQFL